MDARRMHPSACAAATTSVSGKSPSVSKYRNQANTRSASANSTSAQPNRARISSAMFGRVQRRMRRRVQTGSTSMASPMSNPCHLQISGSQRTILAEGLRR